MKKIKEPQECYWTSWQKRHNYLIAEKMSNDEILKYLITSYKVYKKSGGDSDEFLGAIAELQACITLIARKFGAEGKQKSDTYSIT